VEALDKEWGRDWRREWYSARKPLVKKVYRWVAQGCPAIAAVELVEREPRASLALS
jgi:hypothetical protein